MRTVRALLLASLILVGAGSAAAQDAGPKRARVKVGEMHPEVRLPTIDRARTVSLSGLRGKKVLLIEFASW